MDSKELVFKTLKEASEPLKAGEIVDKTGLDKKDVDKAMKILKEEDKIVSPKRWFFLCYWA